MKAGKSGRVHRVSLSDVTQARAKSGLSQAQFAQVLGVSIRTHQEWAEVLDDLRAPPGNRLEALKENRAGQHSIRINDQFRVCFVWTEEGARNVEIVDYH